MASLRNSSKTPIAPAEPVILPADTAGLSALLVQVITAVQHLEGVVRGLRVESAEHADQVAALAVKVQETEDAILQHKPISTTATAGSLDRQAGAITEISRTLQGVHAVSRDQAAYTEQLASRLSGVEDIVRQFGAHSLEMTAHAVSNILDARFTDLAVRVGQLANLTAQENAKTRQQIVQAAA